MNALDDTVAPEIEVLDPARLRRALGGFPTGVTVVTARLGGDLVAMTANSFASVSLDPPLVSWCVANGTPSHAVFAEADSYAVHLLGAEHQDVALRFAGKSADKFVGMVHRPGLTGAPILDGLAPVFECRVWARYPGGDHTILVGEVVRLVDRVQDPLLFHSGVLRPIERMLDHDDDEPSPEELRDLLVRAGSRLDEGATRITAGDRATIRRALDLLANGGTRETPFDPTGSG